MGSILSSGLAGGRETERVASESEAMNTDAIREVDPTDHAEEFHDAADENAEREYRAKAKEDEMNEFRKHLSIKREQRKEILARHRSEKEELEKSLKSERATKLELYQKNQQLRELLQRNNIEIPENLQSSEETLELTDAVIHIREEFEKFKADNNKLRRDLVDANNSLQSAYADIADLNAQHIESIRNIQALKEVVAVSKTLLNLREGQLEELKSKLSEIERSLSDKEANMLSVDLRQEYERQLQNIRTLRGLYEERARLAEVTRQSLVRELEEQKVLYQVEINKCKDLTDKVEALEAKVDALQETIENKNSDISTYRDETNCLKAEMTVVNKLFSQVLLGYKTKQDLDKLVHRLEENHGILTHMAENENDAEASSALPKLLLELVNQVDEIEDNNEHGKTQNENTLSRDKQISTEEVVATPSTTAEEIVENLPKVWRVLMELLSHQTVADDPVEKVTTCYKSVETKSGPVLVPSVSQTYIRLKDLIVEKLGLIKEVNRMKQLNTHLESRLQEQEKRLCLVTTELGKTWNVVGKLRKHHYQLHTHEKILKYELQQKRKLLNELKEELEYCREKWEQAREKNTQSERDWRKLRAEFSSRKTKSGSPSFNNSAESGYSDERPSDDSSESNDESEYVSEPLIRCKKKIKKSLENVLDSSADCNLAAEREDPVSDMLDVADLPLDTHSSFGDDHEASSVCSKSENILKSEKLSETEDEIGDITYDDSCIGETKDHEQDKIVSSNQNNDTGTVSLRYSISPSKPSCSSSSDTFVCIRNQNENLTIEDESTSTSNIFDETKITSINLTNEHTSSFSKQTSAGIDQSQTSAECEVPAENNNLQTEHKIDKIIYVNGSTPLNESIEPAANSPTDGLSTQKASGSTTECTVSQAPLVDFKAILESVKKQNERLAKKDERLQNLEAGCAEVVKNIETTLNSSEEIIEKLDILHIEHGNTEETELASGYSSKSDKNNDDNNSDSCEPTTSADIDHEARFAARDIRLKRLEEQTKSLVNKVNKTTSKGVKINYKLDELHNIYGSENSRAGTPSEDNEDRSNGYEDDDTAPE